MTQPLPKSDRQASWEDHGCSLCETEQFREAIAAFDQALAINPNAATAWNFRGNALSGLQRYAEALFAYDRAVALQPSYHQAWFNRGQLLTDMGAYGNALESYDRAIALQADPRYWHAREDIWVSKKLFPAPQSEVVCA